MNHKSIVCAAGLAAVLWSQASGGPPRRENKTAEADPRVLRVLRSEVAGQVDRRDALAQGADVLSVGPAALWQAGFVRNGDGWTPFDQPDRPASVERTLAEYRDRRARAPAAPEGQLRLADWCRDHRLPDQERAHLFAHLAAEPDRDPAPILRRLGFRRVLGQWLSREQLRDWRRLNRQAEASLERWKPRLERIARQLGGSTRQQEQGRTALRDLRETAAIPAIERVLCGRSEPAALAAVQAIARLEGFEASTALARQGVFSSWPTVRAAAAESLQERNLDDFVPDLIGLLATPLQAEHQLIDSGLAPRMEAHIGALFYTLVLSRETRDQVQVATLRTINLMTDDHMPIQVEGEGQGVTGSLFAVIRGRNDALRALTDLSHAQEHAVEDFNARTAETNERVATILSAVSREKASNDPRFWWEWWNTHSELEQLGDKQTVAAEQTLTLGDQAYRIKEDPIKTFRREVLHVSCFAAGTPVWTETGLVSIETIRIGDRVLSKDVETGELAYQPVLATTVRPPRERLTLRLEGERIVCTGGHRFWVSGTGWVKARDLAAGSHLHTATGNTPVWRGGSEQAAETYNLVVDDFHTYFVGEAGVLCQDLLAPPPTNMLVPGFDRASLSSPR